MSKESTALVPRAIQQGLQSIDNLKEIIRENLGGGSLSFSDMTRISIPSGGSTVWQIEKADGSVENKESIDGVVVYFADNKAYWRDSIDETGGGSPPDCYSSDMTHGLGDPKLQIAPPKDEQGYICATCPHNQFGSAKEGTGKGKSCKDIRVMYVLTGNSLLPVLVVAPPTSIKGLRKQFLDLALEQGLAYHGIKAKLVLEMDKNSAGTKYSKVKIIFGEPLSEDGMKTAKEYNTLMKELVAKRSVPTFATGNQPSEDEKVQYDDSI